MPLITNTLAVAGDTITATELNDKNDAVVSVFTDGVDADNVRHEGLDLPQFVRGTGGMAGIILVKAAQQSTGTSIGSGTAYAQSGDVNFREIAHDSGTEISFGAGGVALEDGDILRLYFGVFVDDLETTVRYPVSAYRENPCWLIYPQWDITSNSLTHYDEPPKQTSFTTVFTDGVAPLDAVGGETEYDSGDSGTDATIVIDHLAYQHDGASLIDVHPKSTSRFRGYSYINNTGSSITIYGLRLVIDGLFYPWYTSGEPKNRFVHVETDSGTDSITISKAYIIALVQRIS